MTTIMKPSRITIHCSATPNGKRYDISKIADDHRARGFSKVGYHLVIQPDGEVQQGRPLNQMGAHVEGDNHGNLGVCLIGTDKYTDAQWQSLRYQLDGLFLTFGIEKTELYAHHQFHSATQQGKTCPNVPINAILLWYYEIVPESAIAPYKL